MAKITPASLLPQSIRFIRHAESTFNNGKELNKANVDITMKGVMQAKQLEGDYDLIICSTMKRARQTLDSSKITYNDIIFTYLCREYNITPGHPANQYSHTEKPETLEEANERRKLFIELLKDMSKTYKRIAVVSHHGFIRSITGESLNNAGSSYGHIAP